MFNNQKDRIAIIETGDGKYFLPGGGIENTETHEECIKREALEEMGMEIEVGHFIGCAQRYFFPQMNISITLAKDIFIYAKWENR